MTDRLPVPSADALAAHSAHFRKQADWCDRLGSPFNGALLRGLADRLGQGGPLDGLLLEGAEPLSPEAADAGPLRVAGALHALVLTARSPDLVALYPRANLLPDMGALIDAVEAAFITHQDWVADFLTRPPQTNETRRSVALLPAFAKLAAESPGPLHLLEVGASAGLNLNWDRFNYDGGAWWFPGDPSGPVMDTEWQGAPPALPGRFEIGGRRGCDRDPIDLTDPDMRLRLKAYIWPDQADRLTRLDGALALADRNPVTVDRSDAAPWLEAQLSGELPKGTTVIFHSIAWQYFDAGTHRRCLAAIEAAGARSDGDHRLAWVRFEHGKVFGQGTTSAEHLVDMVTWPGGAQRLVARADPHARQVSVEL